MLVKVLPLFIFSSLILTAPLRAGELEELLKDKGNANLNESETFKRSWEKTLDALARRDYPQAETLLKTLEAERGYIEPRRRDFLRLSSRLLHYKTSLETDKATFRTNFKGMGETIIETRLAIGRMEKEAQSLAAQYGNNVPPLTKRNMEEKYVALKEDLKKLQEQQTEMQAQAGNFEASRKDIVEKEVCAWIGRQTDEEAVRMGLIISSMYLDQVGESSAVSAASQDLHAQQKRMETATKIVTAITAEIQPLVDEGKAAQAKDALESRIAQVQSSSQEAQVKFLVMSRLRAISLTATSASQTQQLDSAALTGRLDTLETRLSQAQDLFATAVRSVDGFADYSGSTGSLAERLKLNELFNEKVKSNQISRDKIDNLVKAKSQHLGILREVETLQKDVKAPSTVQKGRMVNLQTSAKQALDMLEGV